MGEQRLRDPHAVAHEEVVVSHVWRFDINRRRYPPHRTGHFAEAPIYREHWAKAEITGETSRSWITSYGKCPKNGGPGWALKDRDVDLDVWAHDNRYRISDIVRRCTPLELRALAVAINYDPEPPPL